MQAAGLRAPPHLCIRQRHLLHAAQQLQLQVTRGPGGVAGRSQQWQELLAQQGEGGSTGLLAYSTQWWGRG